MPPHMPVALELPDALHVHDIFDPFCPLHCPPHIMPATELSIGPPPVFDEPEFMQPQAMFPVELPLAPVPAVFIAELPALADDIDPREHWFEWAFELLAIPLELPVEWCCVVACGRLPDELEWAAPAPADRPCPAPAISCVAANVALAENTIAAESKNVFMTAPPIRKEPTPLTKARHQSSSYHIRPAVRQQNLQEKGRAASAAAIAATCE